jgi:hypothetical protein
MLLQPFPSASIALQGSLHHFSRHLNRFVSISKPADLGSQALVNGASAASSHFSSNSATRNIQPVPANATSSASKSSNVTHRDISSCKQSLQFHSPSAAKTQHPRQCPHSSISGSVARTTRRSGFSSFGAPSTTQQQKLQHLRCCNGIQCQHQMLQHLLNDGSVSCSDRRKLRVSFSSPLASALAFSYTASA